MPPIVLEEFDLENAERRLCIAALELTGSIIDAARVLGITRHALKRRIVKLQIGWPQRPASAAAESAR